MLINSFFVDFKKIFIGYGFYTGIILTFILCIFAPVYYDFSTSENYTTMRCLFEFDRTYMLNDTSFSSCNIAMKGCQGFISMFSPIIVAFASVPILCDEYNSGNIRFNILRTTKTKYFLSKFTSSSICGGIVLLFGFCLYVIFSYIIFPNISNYPVEIRNLFEEDIINSYPNFAEFGYAYVLLKKCIEVFCYGVMASIPSVILTSIIRNKYLVICIPFFLKYVTIQTCNKLSAKSMDNLDTFLLKAVKIVNPDSLLNIYIYPEVQAYITIFNIIVFLIGLILFIIMSEAKYDCGE